MADLILKYGSVVETNTAVKFNYSAPGIAANVLFAKSTAEAGIRKQATMIEAVAERNIDYIGGYISFIEEGKHVAQAKNAVFMVADTAEGVKQACEDWQGGFVKLYTLEDLSDMQAPYQGMLNDALLLDGWALLMEATTPVVVLKPKWWQFWKRNR